MLEKKLAGIWMDTEHATVVKNHDIEHTSQFFICKPVKRIIQGKNSSERSAHNADHTNTEKFFKELEHLITNTEKLYLTGTGDIQEQFKHHLAKTALFKNLEVTLDTDQPMSNEHFLEHVKTHFHAK